jgi:hypothetical protein
MKAFTVGVGASVATVWTVETMAWAALGTAMLVGVHRVVVEVKVEADRSQENNCERK